MIAIRTNRELDLLRKANSIVADVLSTLAERVAPGVTTEALNAEADAMIRAAGGKPSFLGYQGFPKSACISVDEEIVHGIPGKRKLKDNEIVSIDVGVNYKGYYGDAALSVACGELDDDRQRLMDTTERSLAAALEAARAGNYVRDISRAVQSVCESEGFAVVRNFVGHGIGSEMHEEPQIPNFDTGERGAKLKAGMVIAIEPMVNLGTENVKVLSDGWTAITADRRPSAHFEHSIVVRDGFPEVLSLSPKRTWGIPEGVRV